MGGCIGLDYSILPFVLEMNGVDRERWPRVFADVRLLEGEALAAMHEGV